MLGAGYAVYEALFPAYLLRHPERRGKDVETTRRSVKSFACIPPPLSISLKAPVYARKTSANPLHFSKLVATKGAGIAMALNVLGKQFDKLLNVRCVIRTITVSRSSIC